MDLNHYRYFTKLDIFVKINNLKKNRMKAHQARWVDFFLLDFIWIAISSSPAHVQHIQHGTKPFKSEKSTFGSNTPSYMQNKRCAITNNIFALISHYSSLSNTIVFHWLSNGKYDVTYLKYYWRMCVKWKLHGNLREKKPWHAWQLINVCKPNMHQELCGMIHTLGNKLWHALAIVCAFCAIFTKADFLCSL